MTNFFAANEKKPRILVVDDDEVFGRILMRVAEQEGIPLAYYSSVREAYRDMDELDFDLALIDFELGPVTGAQLSNFMVSRNVKAPVILMSANQVLPTAIPWSAHVRKIESKSRGPIGLLYDALKICNAA